MALPDFLIIGAPKAGSTALHAALVQHPQLHLSSPKEPKYFLTGDRPPGRDAQQGPGDAHSAREWIWQRDRYEKLFEAAPADTLKGESTPFYLWSRAAQRRIHAAAPGTKLVAVIRDPVERAYSNWTHMWSDGLEAEPDFVTACALESRRVAAGWAPFWRYLELGRYGEQLAHLFDIFPREQVHVLRYRKLVEEPASSLNAIATFLGVETGGVTDVPSSNMKSWANDRLLNTALRATVRVGARAGAYTDPRVWRQAQRPLIAALQRGDEHRPTLPVNDRRLLAARFADDIALLERLLGESFQDWLGDTGRGTYAVRRSLAPSGRDASQ